MKPKLARPRMSLKVFLLVVASFCCYLACWKPTIDTGVPEMQQQEGIYFATAPMPLVISTWEDSKIIKRSPPYRTTTGALVVDLTSSYRKRYYFWFAGFTVKLPYEGSATGFSYWNPKTSQRERRF